MARTPQFIDSFVSLYVSPCILLALYSLFGGEQSHAQFLVSSLSASFPVNRERRKMHIVSMVSAAATIHLFSGRRRLINALYIREVAIPLYPCCCPCSLISLRGVQICPAQQIQNRIPALRGTALISLHLPLNRRGIGQNAAHVKRWWW